MKHNNKQHGILLAVLVLLTGLCATACSKTAGGTPGTVVTSTKTDSTSTFSTNPASADGASTNGATADGATAAPDEQDDTAVDKNLTGLFLDNHGEVNLIIKPNGNEYTVQISIYNLLTLNHGSGKAEGDKITFSASAPDGSPVSGIITPTPKGADVTFTKSSYSSIAGGDKYSYYRIASDGAASPDGTTLSGGAASPAGTTLSGGAASDKTSPSAGTSLSEDAASPGAPASDTGYNAGYNSQDIAFFNTLIDQHNLPCAKNVPEDWGEYVTWDHSYPKMISKLSLSGIGLTGQLDMSGLSGPALTSLDCSNNQLTSLTGLSGLTGLKKLYCAINPLQTLDVSGLKSMTLLACHHNQLQTLDLSGNTALSELYCAANQLSTLDVTGLTALTTLDCTVNPLTSFPGLSDLSSLEKLDCSNCQLQTLDVSGLTSLIDLNCHKNRLVQLTGFSDLSHLQSLYCNSNQLAALDLSGLTSLTSLDCSDNQLNSLDLSAQGPMTDMVSDDNPISLFKRKGGELNLNTGPGGSVTIFLASPDGNEVGLSALPDYEYSFNSWKGLPVGTPNTPITKFPLEGSLNVTAVFALSAGTAPVP